MAFESLLAHTRLQVRTASQRSRELSHLVLDGWEGDVYNEEAFRHFLSIERTRSNRSKRNFLLLLISLRRSSDLDVDISRALSGTIFSAIRDSVREVDFVGWYRSHKIAAAVLPQGLDVPGAASARVVARVTSVLGQRLPGGDGARLRVRIVPMGSKTSL